MLKYLIFAAVLVARETMTCSLTSPRWSLEANWRTGHNYREPFSRHYYQRTLVALLPEKMLVADAEDWQVGMQRCC